MIFCLRWARPDGVTRSKILLALECCVPNYRDSQAHHYRSYQVWEGVYDSQCPIVPSHEPVGTIVALGPTAKAQGKWKIGQRVGIILFQNACHHCISCATTKDVRFCKNAKHAGLHNDGGMAEYMVADAEAAVELPDAVPFEQAASLMCAGVSLSLAGDVH